MSIVTIILILVAIGLLGCLLEWIRDNIVPILIVVAIILGLIFIRKPTLIVLGVAVGIYILYLIIRLLTPICQSVLSHLDNRRQARILIKEQRKEKERQEAESRKLKRKEEEIIAALPNESKEFIELSQECISGLEEEKTRIRNTEMVDKVTECQNMIHEICEEVKQFPETITKLSKLTTYYYPTILKLVKKYSVYERRDSDDNNVKNQILTAMSDIHAALKVLQGDIISADDIDVLTDISVMKQMIDRDGLKEGIKK